MKNLPPIATTGTTEAADPTAAATAAAVTEAQAELARTDSKAGVLLTLSTGALAGTLTFARAGHAPPASIALWGSSALTAAALALLLSVVRPRIDSSRGNCFADHEQLLARNVRLEVWQSARLRMFSALAVAKHRRLRYAVDLLYVSLAILGAAVALIVITGGAS